MRYVATILLSVGVITVSAQDKPAFEVVSIKRHTGTDAGMGMRTEPDGTTRMTNVTITLALSRVLPVPLRDVLGLPDWVSTERYDLIAKPPEGASRSDRDAQREMWRAMFTERMKLAFHVEQRERDVYTLLVAHTDGTLGPQLAPSTLDCKTVPPLSFNGQMPGLDFFQHRCAIGGVGNTMASGGVSIDQLARFLEGTLSASIDNRTGLEGMYAFTLTFSRPLGGRGPSVTPSADEPPDVFTAVQEQLGLKLQRSRKVMDVYVIDHIERPSEN